MVDEKDMDRMKELKVELQKHLDFVIDMTDFYDEMNPKQAYVTGYQRAHENLQKWIEAYEKLEREINWFIVMKKQMRTEILNDLSLCPCCRDEITDS